ncbi:hypothetical protein CEXT_434161 [Caerostris extrusa]|uniref:Uncharacterized protein n=1 Tax=Caerostris extrusa TaxID=172846 RepID=A0AAV4YC76_CAEEX|nr:hypothetical protein CEXT_434161 [Caerostris extrusa]
MEWEVRWKGSNGRRKRGICHASEETSASLSQHPQRTTVFKDGRAMAKRVRRKDFAAEQSTPFQSFPLLHSRNARGISSAPKALGILKNSYPAGRLSERR